MRQHSTLEEKKDPQISPMPNVSSIQPQIPFRLHIKTPPANHMQEVFSS